MNRYFLKLAGSAAVLMGLVSAGSAVAGPSEAYWHDDAGRALSSDAPHPAAYRALSLDLGQASAYLRHGLEQGVSTAIDIPLPTGGFAEFHVVDSGTFPAELRARYPEIMSFKGTDVEGRALRLDVSPQGFHAMVFDPAGVWVVRPESFGNGINYMSFRRADLQVPEAFECDVHGQNIDAAGLNLVPTPSAQTGATRRVYRTAIAANNRYITAVGGGTVAGGLAATTIALNRVTQVYESELSIQLTLVPNNDLIMYPTAASDPFSANGTGVINNSTSIINAAIGVNNYDIGHVFTTGSGGVAGLGVVCGGAKARGTTGLPNPTGDAFYIDFVAHEMGHQFAGNHPFNGSVGNCSGGNRNGSTAYEPGSGSSIQAYAGICGADNLQPNSDPFFHAISLQEISNFTNNASTGGSCSANTVNPNAAPVINTASLPNGLTIPSRTPFVLNATATDADGGDTLYYSWEQWDLGPQAPLTAGDNGSSPIFRSLPPKLTGERVFPTLSTVLGGAAVIGETLPTTNRALKFRLTVRDQRPGSGTSQSADIALTVNAAAGPFRVTSPATAVSWSAGQAQTVTWDVANTSAAPVSCSAVNIDLSTDGGQTYPVVLATGVANSGSSSISVPSVSTTQARVRVRCANNIFFHVSPVNFSVTPASGTFTVSGNVTNLAGTGLVLSLNGGSNLPVNSNGSFSFPTALAPGAAYAVTVATAPTNPFQNCTVTNGTGTMPSGNVSNVVVNCVTETPVAYTVGGTVTGLTGTGLALKLNGEANYSIAANGSFTFPTPVNNGSPYAVIVATQPVGQTCTVASGSGTVAGANVTNVAVTCGATPPTSFTVSGTVSGLTGTGLRLRLNSGANLIVAGNGPFAFTTQLANGAAYNVIVVVQPTGPVQTCTVTNGSGTIAGANVTNVAVTCGSAPATYTVGGNVAGLTGTGFTLLLNGGNSLAVAADGAFTFPGGLAGGAAYAVTVGSQPGTPAQTCTVANGTGTIGSSNVTNVAVTCVAVSDVIFADGFEVAAPVACQLLQDPSFEATDPDTYANPFWTSTSTNYGDSLCFTDGCDGLPARTGNVFAYFGGFQSATPAEVATVSQTVTIPSGRNYALNFWMAVPFVTSPYTDTVRVKVDGNTVWTYDEPSTVQSAYAAHSVDLSAFADNAAHAITIEYTHPAGGIMSDVLVDDVTLDCTL